MHKKRWLSLVVAFLLLTTLACSLGGGGATAPAAEAPAVEEAAPPAAEEAPAQEEAPPAAGAESDFPLPEDVDPDTVMDLGDGAINFQTTLTLPDAVTFYRFAFADLGYTEREINTSIEDTTFSMVFDGHESGIEIVIQGVDLGESVNINIRFEDI